MTIDSDKFTACLLGLAVGDAIGLPREGLSPRRARRLFGNPPLRHRFFLRRGMISDDTEHACMTGQALLFSQGEPNAFARSLAWRLRGWLLALPAGIGYATLRSIVKLWLGVPPARSGVISAGNGPAMRAPILGLWCAASHANIQITTALVSASTRITHTDPRASEGALVIALAVSHAASSIAPAEILNLILPHVAGNELRCSLEKIPPLLFRQACPSEFAQSIGVHRGVTGYINHTVPIALYCFLRWPTNFRQAVEDAVLLGGDADTVAAIVGALSGASLGTSAIPPEWLQGLLEYPRSVRWMTALAQRLASAAQNSPQGAKPLALAWPALLLRNPFFMFIVLLHGFRRLLPPY